MIRTAAPTWSIVLFVVVLAIVLRCGAMVQSNALRLRDSEETVIAKHLAAGRGFSFAEYGYFGPTSIRPPVYPMLQALAIRLVGDGSASSLIMLALNALAGGASVALAFAVGRRLFRSERAAFIACVLFAILPTQLYAGVFQQGLSIAVMLMLAVIWLVLRNDIRLAFPTGLLAGAMLLTESVLILPVVSVIGWVARHGIGQAAIVFAATLAVILPWMVRNGIVHRQLTGITNELWDDAFIGSGPDATGSPHLHKNASPLARLSPMESDQLRRQPESVRTRLMRQWTVSWIGSHKWAYARLCAQRLLKTVWLDWDHPHGLNAVNVVSRTGCLIAWGVALVVMFKSRRFEPVTIALSLGIILATVFTLAEARNAVFMDIPQTLAIAWLFDRRPA